MFDDSCTVELLAELSGLRDAVAQRDALIVALRAEIAELQEDKVVLCDHHYVPSSLVLQRLDSIPTDIVWQLNRAPMYPDMAVLRTSRLSDHSALTVCLTVEPSEALLTSDPASATSLLTLF